VVWEKSSLTHCNIESQVASKKPDAGAGVGFRLTDAHNRSVRVQAYGPIYLYKYRHVVSISEPKPPPHTHVHT
jgi:hypothetical protein